MQKSIAPESRAVKNSVARVLSLEKVANPMIESDQDIDLILQCAHMLEQLYPDKVVLLCQEHHKIFKYASANAVNLFGYSKEILESFSLENLISIIHPEDLEHVKLGLTKLQEFSDISPVEKKVIFTYRVRMLDGNYIIVHDEKVCLRTPSSTLTYFNIYSKCKDEKSPVKLEVYKRFAGNRMIRVYEFFFRDNTKPFSTRELEIIKLLDKGLDTISISEALSISVFTVKNHKQNMFKKAQVNNSRELTRYARSLHLI